MKTLFPLSFLLFTLLLLSPLTVFSKVQEQDPDSPTVNIQFISSSQFIDQPSQTFNPTEVPPKSLINVNSDRRYQTIQGVGATLTESSAYLIRELPQPLFLEVLNNLFNQTSGIGINYIRLPITSCDFALNSWTFDEMFYQQTDPDFSHFSISHTYTHILPVLKQIKLINPDVKIMATPWSPPGWMKNTDTTWGTRGALNSSLLFGYYATYATYLVKVIQAFQEQGINFDTLSIQNAPLLAPNHSDGMIMKPEEQVLFINDYLIPEFIKRNITSTKILVYDFDWENADYAFHVLGNLSDDAKKFVQGTAFHCYSGNVSVQTDLHRQFPEFSIFMSECSNGGWLNDTSDALINDMKNVFIGPANNFGEVFLKLNIALTSKFGPQQGPCKDCWPLITIGSPYPKPQIIYEADYYSTAVFSKFVKPGARRIDVKTEDQNLLVTGFIDKQYNLTIIVANLLEDEYDFVIVWGDEWIESTLPGKNVGVYKWNLN